MEARYLHPVTEPGTAVRLEDRLRLLMDTGISLRSEQNPDVLLQMALGAARTLCAAEAAVFYSRIGVGNSNALHPGQTSGDSALLEALAKPSMVSFVASVANGTEVFRTDEPNAHEGLRTLGSLTSDGASSRNVSSIMVLPLGHRGARLWGAAAFAHAASGVFDQEGVSLATVLLQQAACMVENHDLHTRMGDQVKRAESAQTGRHEAERRLRQALDTNQLGTWRWNADTGTMDLDERGAELLGVPPNMPLSRSQLRDHLVFKEDLSRVPEDLSAVLASGSKYQAEYRIRDRDGNLRWIASSGLPAVDETTGQISSMVGTVQDITFRKVQEESLRQSEKLAATGRMAATIAHEINNPLEAVTNLIYLAKTDPSATPDIQRMLETADLELARVSQIAQQTLGFYRDTTRPVSIDLNELVTAVVGLFGRKTAGKRLRVTMDLDPGLTVVGLQGEIRQVVSNLLINAIDASETDAGPIRIRARHRCRNGCHGVCLMISDQGSGIPSHVRGRLFTPFVTTKESRGTGLGLWVTRGMVEKHGGSVRFRSCTNAPTGTVFSVFLPQNVSREAFASPSSAVLQ